MERSLMKLLWSHGYVGNHSVGRLPSQTPTSPSTGEAAECAWAAATKAPTNKTNKYAYLANTYYFVLIAIETGRPINIKALVI